MTDFVSLHNQTDFSILDSVISTKALFNKAKELGQTAIAVTDHGTLAGTWDAFKISKTTGVKLIIGCECYFKDEPNSQDRLRHIVFLAKNAIGYKNLLTINKFGFDQSTLIGKRVYPIIDWNLLEKYSEGLICLTACGNGIINQLLMNKEFDKAEQTILRLKDIFGENLGLEIQPNNMKRGSNIFNDEIDQQFLNRRNIELGKKFNIKVVPTCNAHYLNKEDSETHDVLLAIGSHQPIYSNFRLRYPVSDFYLKSADEVKSFFARNYGDECAEELCNNTVYFANMCENPEWIDPKYSNPSGKELPIFPVKDEPDYQQFIEWSKIQPSNIQLLDEDKQYLRYLCSIKFNSRIKNVPDDKLNEYYARIEEELDVLEFHGFSSYMLIVADYINWSRKNGIAVGAGRGCLFADGLVLSENGFKKIKDIKPGDKVYSHTGKLQKVIDTFEYKINEFCTKINTEYSFKDLVFTNDHKLYAAKQRLTKNYLNSSKDTRKKIKKYDILDNPTWIPISELNVGDFIFMPFVKRTIDSTIIPTSINIKKSSTKNSNLDLNLTIPIDNDFIYFLGRWVGDGWITNHNSDSYEVGLAFNSNDIKSINWFETYLNKYFNCCKVKSKTKKLVQLVVHNKSFFSFIESIFPNYNKTSESKHLPIFFRNLSNDQLLLLLEGYLESDGYVEKLSNGSNYRFSCDSTSERLILELRELLNYLKLKSYVSIRKPFTIQSKNKYYNCKTSYKLRFTNKPCKEEGYWVKIKSLIKEKCDKVYDINVDVDHSYITQNFAAHNSVGGSLVAYLLGIHQADPIKHGLIFARFHNKEKSSFPDIDTDFAPSGRDLVQNYLKQKYGEDHVAHVSNVNTITPKVYARDIARACELGGSRESAIKIGNDVADCIPAEIHSIDEAYEKIPLFVEYCKKYPEFIKFKQICGKYRAWSTHAGGIIISKRSLIGLIPLRKDKDGALAIEYDKEKAEENGLVKMDMLGLSTLDIISEAMKLIKESGKQMSDDTIDYDQYDEKTYNLISSGDTFGVFQLGTSGGTIDLCRRIKPENIGEIANINGLARPSARDMRNDFIATKNGKKEMALLHPSLQRGFGSTYGFGLYEECLMYLAQDVAGWSLHEADRLRKLTKEKGKNPEKARKWRLEFIDNAVKNNVNEEIAKRIWDEVVDKFQGYGFNKSLHFSEYIDTYTPDGIFISTKYIKDIQPNDYIRSRDEISKKDIYVKVLDKHNHGVLPLVEVELTTGEKVKCTMNHKFRVEENGEMHPLWKIIKEDWTIIINTVDINADQKRL